jgi:hypothetical protein
METPLLLKIMLSWAIMIFCFTALFAGAHQNREKFNTDENEDEKEVINSKQSEELQSDLKKLQLEFKHDRKASEDGRQNYSATSGGSVLNATHRNKDAE